MTVSKLVKMIRKDALQSVRMDFMSIGHKWISAEYLVFSMMKFALMKQDEDEDELDCDQDELQGLKDLFESGSVVTLDKKQFRSELRQKGLPTQADNDYVAYLDTMAATLATMEGSDEVTALILLKAIRQYPSDFLGSILVKDKPKAKSGSKSRMALEEAAGIAPKKKAEETAAADSAEAADQPAGEEDSDKIRKLFQFSRTKQSMRENLLARVIGQDEAVNAFVEGVMASDMLEADSESNRPKGIFVFAGPPGVGKTFLAERGAAELGIPVKRFDMSEFASDHAKDELIGYSEAFKGTTEGQLTGFVAGCNKMKKECFLIFDEIEKAHLSVIHLFLQILDAGRLTDAKTKKTVSFRDAYIVFTTNAGRSLYEGKQPEKGMAKSVILDALRNDVNPVTREPFFPDAILSRMSTGYTVMFRHLEAHNLVSISEMEMRKYADKFQQTYGPEVVFDREIPFLLLLKQGGESDARSFRAESEKFIRNQLFGLGDAVEESRFMKVIGKNSQIRIMIDQSAKKDLEKIMGDAEDGSEIMVVSEDAERAESLTDMFTGTEGNLQFLTYTSYEQAVAEMASGKKNPSVIIVDLPESRGGSNATERFTGKSPLLGSFYTSFLEFLKDAREEMPEATLCVTLDKPAYFGTNMVSDLMDREVSYVLNSEGTAQELQESLEDILYRNRLGAVAFRFGREKKGLVFSTAPSDTNGQITIRLRNFGMETLVSGEDSAAMVSEDRMPTTTFDGDIIGQEETKAEVKEFIAFLQNPRKYRAISGEQPKGLLLYGPPGTGKTFFAKALAHEAGVPFFPANGSSFVNKFVGSGPEAVRQLFAKARKYAPSIVFIDEIDAIGKTRTGSENTHSEEETLNMLLSEMDGFDVDTSRPVFVVAATNFDIDESSKAHLDPALVRRFSRTVLVDLPCQKDRAEYFRRELKKYGVQIPDADVENVATRSVGMSFGNLKNVVEKARRDARGAGVPLNGEILDNALETIKYGEKKDWGADMLERVAWHETGHAFMNWKCGMAPEYITITARGNHGGYVMPGKVEDKPLWTRREKYDRVKTSLAGRAAEIVRYGEEEGLSTGPSGDFESACWQLYHTICTYGMDEKLGIVYVKEKDEIPEEIRSRINELLHTLLEETVEELKANKELLQTFVKNLLEKNKLTRDEIDAIFSKGENA